MYPHCARNLLCTLVVVLAAIAAGGCSEDPALPQIQEPPATPTWKVVQDQILTPRCTGCHVEGSPFARQSGLVLTPDVAYSQLVGVLPTNAAARAVGLSRLGTKGLESLYESFLWEKINAPDQEHFYADHPHYGAPMPFGEPPLTNGELKFIRRWIVAGAPETGAVTDTTLLADTSRYEPPAFQDLAPPATGIQLRLGPFEVAPHFERELYSYVPLNQPQDLLIERVEVVMRPGSHHFILYFFRDGTPSIIFPPANTLRDIRNLDGTYIPQNLFATQYHNFLAGTQWPLMNYKFPPGVALRLAAGKGIDMNSHYVNRTDTPVQGEVVTNLHLADPAQVQHVAEVMFLNYDRFELPPQQVTTVTRTFVFRNPLNVFQLFSHAHEHMREFRVFIDGGPRHGELVYLARDWQHPPILQLDPPLRLEKLQGLKLVVTYDNWTDRTLRFGLLSQDEMMILFGYYYTDSGGPAAVDALP